MIMILLDKDDIEMIKILYKEGLTQARLADMYKVGIKIIRKVLKRQYKIRGEL